MSIFDNKSPEVTHLPPHEDGSKTTEEDDVYAPSTVENEDLSEFEKAQRLSDEKTRIQNPADAYHEAHLIDYRYGGKIKNIGEAKIIHDKFNDGRLSEIYKSQQTSLMEDAAAKENDKIQYIVLEAAKMNIDLNPFITAPRAENGVFLYEKLRSDESDIGFANEAAPSEFNLSDMEHLAGKLGTEVKSLKESDGKGGYIEYPVVTLSESAKEATFITNGTGLESDNNPRIFKMSKENMSEFGYTLETKTDFRSIYPHKNKEWQVVNQEIENNRRKMEDTPDF